MFERSADVSPEKQAVLNTLGPPDVGALHARCCRTSPTRSALRCSVGEAGHTCWVACHGLISLTVNHPKLDWSAPPERMTEVMLDTLLNGLIAQ